MAKNLGLKTAISGGQKWAKIDRKSLENQHCIGVVLETSQKLQIRCQNAFSQLVRGISDPQQLNGRIIPEVVA